MAGLDDLYAQIPTAEIATKLGAEKGEVDSAVHTLVPVLLSGLQHNSQDPEHASRIESAATSHATSGLLDVGGGLDQVDEGDGQRAVATLFGGFGGNDADQVASALAKGGAGNSDLIKQLLPIVLPIVLAYIGKRLGADGAPASDAPQQKESASSGGLGEILGSILGNALGGKGGALGDILGGVLGGKK
jgi:hypothetical protein